MHMSPPDKAEDAAHNNAYNIALWMLYRRWFNDEAKRSSGAPAVASPVQGPWQQRHSQAHRCLLYP